MKFGRSLLYSMVRPQRELKEIRLLSGGILFVCLVCLVVTPDCMAAFTR